MYSFFGKLFQENFRNIEFLRRFRNLVMIVKYVNKEVLFSDDFMIYCDYELNGKLVCMVMRYFVLQYKLIHIVSY